MNYTLEELIFLFKHYSLVVFYAHEINSYLSINKLVAQHVRFIRSKNVKDADPSFAIPYVRF